MRAYVASTGVVFLLIVLVHLWRLFAESPALIRDPWYVVITLIAAGLASWAWRLLRLRPNA